MIKINNTIEQKIELKKIFDVNRAAWNLISPAHEHAEFYNIPKFLESKNSLNKIELNALGDVKGKEILHLQSHICTDSISLVGLGANVTAIDFSEEALKIGKKLSSTMNLPLKIIENNVLNMSFETNFDIAFLSYGALCWIPDLKQYFKLIYNSLKPNSFLYFVDFHSNLLCYDTVTNERKYYPRTQEETIHEFRRGSYASNEISTEYEVFYWIHSVPDILNALLHVGFQIDKIEEIDYLPFDCFPGLDCVNNKWMFKDNFKGLPLLISIKAVK